MFDKFVRVDIICQYVLQNIFGTAHTNTFHAASLPHCHTTLPDCHTTLLHCGIAAFSAEHKQAHPRANFVYLVLTLLYHSISTQPRFSSALGQRAHR
jgi:hypothetical protein